ncbi:hypothetical protein AB6A40_005891 [Gnathostoma spinigerum]|uniref:Protein kinase domain-containing protein n=1 Tax=Gnathostoma spinigerum TaxID=75299 RepID=A0ABD6EIY6_9BILA
MGETPEVATNALAIRLPTGTVLEGRYRFETMQIGKHSTVFRVEDLFDKNHRYSLKVEYDRGDKINYLHQEIAVLHKLMSRKFVPRLYYCERCDRFSLMTTTLYGKSIWAVRQLVPNKLISAGSATRIGVHTLYQLKQLHECGYILRDLKAGDMLLGQEGNETRVIFIVDWGMCRSYVTKDKNGMVSIRPERPKAVIRGILRYCSPRVHERKDVSRADDLWSLMYILIDLANGLPWRDVRTEEPVMTKKLETSDEVLLEGCPKEWGDIMKHIRSLKYQSRPDYSLIFERFRDTLLRLDVTYSDPWDWDVLTQVKENSEQTYTLDTSESEPRQRHRHEVYDESSSSTSDTSSRHKENKKLSPVSYPIDVEQLVNITSMTGKKEHMTPYNPLLIPKAVGFIDVGTAVEDFRHQQGSFADRSNHQRKIR